jgi:hypothetical protein
MKTILTVLSFVLSVASFSHLNAQVTYFGPTVGYNFYNSHARLASLVGDENVFNAPGLNYGIMVQKYISNKSWHRLGLTYSQYSSKVMDQNYTYSFDNPGGWSSNSINDLMVNFEGNVYALNYDMGYILGQKEFDDKSYSYIGFGYKVEFGSSDRVVTSESATASQLAEINQSDNELLPAKSSSLFTFKFGYMYGYQYSFNRNISAFAELHAKTFFFLANEVGINAGLRIRP